MADSIPSDATCIFLYSPRDERMRDQRRMARLSYATPDAARAAYTKAITASPDTEAKIAEYQRQFPDARIVGYGTCDTQKFVLAPPTLASVRPS